MKRLLGAALAACLLVTVAGCSRPSTPASPVFPASVALTSSTQLQATGLTIGLLVAPLDGEGAEYRQVANGAQVAAFRFGLGGLTVSFITASDDGTAEGAKTGMQALIDAGVAGVIVAGAGPHLDDALAAAKSAGMAVLLPYDYSNPVAAPVYRTGPNMAAVTAGLRTALGDAHVTSPLIITQDGYQVAETIDGTALLYVDDPVFTAKMAMQEVDTGAADSVVIEASAATQTELVNQVQALLGGKQLPIILTPQALTPAFSAGLGAAADLRGVLVTVGANTDDSVALQTGLRGDTMSAFLQAVRMAADSPVARNIFGDDTFAPAAPYADTASHDAVVALVRAAELVADKSAPNTAAALHGLSLATGDGLVGGPLGFSSPDALGSNQLVTLYASSQTAGLRPQPGSGQSVPLAWVAMG